MALISAIFLIVVLAALGLYAVRIGGSEQQTANASLLNSRAAAAALSGLEYASYKAAPAGGGPAVCGNQTLNPGGALAGFTVTVTCQQLQVAAGQDVFKLTATARFGVYGRPNYAARTLTRTLSNIP